MTSMPPRYDLHAHSLCSDGALSPSELVHRAAEQGVTNLALTDHDTMAGLAQADQTAQALGITLINGIELSTTWQGQCFHLVGLGIDPNNADLKQLSEQLQQTRLQRAALIADKLQKKQIFGAWQAVSAKAGEGMITRSHFADFLVEQGHVHSHQEAFDYYLGKGRAAYVSTVWVDLAQAVAWIGGAGGVAVLAHPLRYQLSPKWLRWLLTNFKDMGGAGMEVVTSRMNADDIKLAARYASQFDLAGSVGSDFHNPANQWVELGRLASLPAQIRPIWQLLK